jgi:hypothetical protein
VGITNDLAITYSHYRLQFNRKFSPAYRKPSANPIEAGLMGTQRNAPTSRGGHGLDRDDPVVLVKRDEDG